MIWYFMVSYEHLFEWVGNRKTLSIFREFAADQSIMHDVIIEFDGSLIHGCIYEFHGTEEDFLVFILKTSYSPHHGGSTQGMQSNEEF